VNKNDIAPHQSDFLFYSAPDGRLEIEVFYAGETVWLTQDKMSKLFDRTKSTISEHINNVFEEGELERSSVVRKFRTTAADGKSYEVAYYNLDVIISVGYRVKSIEGTRFRKWATEKLREYMIKGFVLDDERLKNGTHFGKDYFEELLERIREIRLSERRLHQKITDIFEMSSDYQSSSTTAKQFFAFVQNKLHWAITGQTAAEIVHTRANAKKDNMGLTSWKRSPKGKILKSDTSIAKNYLSEKELASLRRIVSAFLDLAEDRAERKIIMRMQDWAKFIDQYLSLNDYGILDGAGSISHDKAVKKAAKEYQKFRPIQDKEFISDFDEEDKEQKMIKSDEIKEKKILEILYSKAPNSLSYDLIIEYSPLTKEDTDAVLESLVQKGVLVNDLSRTNRSKIIKPIADRRRSYYIKEFPEHFPVKEHIRVGSVLVPRLLDGDRTRAEDINAIIEAVVDYANRIDEQIEDRIQQETVKIYRQMIGIFGVFVSIFAIIVISTDKLLRFDPAILARSDILDLFLKSMAIFAPVGIVIGGLVWVVIRENSK